MTTSQLRWAGCLLLLAVANTALGQTGGRTVRDPFDAFRSRNVSKSQSLAEELSRPPIENDTESNFTPPTERIENLPHTSQTVLTRSRSESINNLHVTSSASASNQIVIPDDSLFANAEIDTSNYPKFGIPTGYGPLGSAGMHTFSSARFLRNPYGHSVYDSIPNGACASDEWCDFGGCGQYCNDLGLDIFRRKPKHSKGWFGKNKCESCNSCSESDSCPDCAKQGARGIFRNSFD